MTKQHVIEAAETIADNYGRKPDWAARIGEAWALSPNLLAAAPEVLRKAIERWCETEPSPPARSALVEAVRILERQRPAATHRAEGCDECWGTGTRQMARAWVEPPSPEIRAYTYVARCRCDKGMQQSAVLPFFDELQRRWDASPHTRKTAITDRTRSSITWRREPTTPGNASEPSTRDADSRGGAGRRLTFDSTPMARHGYAEEMEPGATSRQENDAMRYDAALRELEAMREPGQEG